MADIAQIDPLIDNQPRPFSRFNGLIARAAARARVPLLSTPQEVFRRHGAMGHGPARRPHLGPSSQACAAIGS
jgi:hypothetical protein